MRKTLIILAVAGIVLGVGSLSDRSKAYAGDEEWAAAGKVLTGLTVLNYFTQRTPYLLGSRQNHCTTHRGTYCRPSCRVIRRPVRYCRRPHRRGYRRGYRRGVRDGRRWY